MKAFEIKMKRIENITGGPVGYEVWVADHMVYTSIDYEKASRFYADIVLSQNHPKTPKDGA